MPDSDDLVALLKELSIAKKTPPNEAQVVKLRGIMKNKTVPFYHRLMAAQLLAASSSTSSSNDVPSLIASLKNRSREEVVQMFVTWCAHVDRHGFPLHGDGYEMFYHLLKTLAKHQEALHKQDYSLRISFDEENKRTALFAVLYYSEVTPGKDSAKCIPLFLKTFTVYCPARWEVVHILVTEVSPGIKSKYELLAGVLNFDINALEQNSEHIPIIAEELAKLAASQEGSSTCVSLLAALLPSVRCEIDDVFLKLITSTDKCTRNNVHRTWLCRLAGDPETHGFLDELLEHCREKCETMKDPDEIPPNCKEIHEWTCIDPYERWEEDEDVYWPSDALLSGTLMLVSLRQKGQADEGLRNLLLRASRWHLEEIRLVALQLLMRFTTLSNEEKRELLLRNLFVDEDNFVKELTKLEISSGDARLEETLARFAKEGHKVALQSLLRLNETRARSVVRDLLLSNDSEKRRMAYSMTGGVHWLTAEQKEIIVETLKYTVTVDDRAIDYLNWLSKEGKEETEMVEKLIINWKNGERRDWIKCAHFLPSSQLESILELNVKRIEELLILSGSNSVNECPSFTHFFENIKRRCMEAKEYSDEMLTRLSLLEHSSRSGVLPTAKAARIVFETILRCRYKAVVDQGATIFETLLKREPAMARKYSAEILCLLSSTTAECRNLSLSRTLLSCSLIDSSLIRSIEDSFLVIYSLPVEIRPSLIRWMKALKLMTAKANETKLSSSFVERLFFICIDLQYLSNDFLEKSAAMCLYSFCILKMVGPGTGRPLFTLLAERPDFSHQLFFLVQKLHSLPRIVSILIFSFLSKLDYVSDDFYGEEWAQRLDDARSSIWSLLLKTGLKRERRFIVDAFLSLTPHEDRETLKEQFEYDREEDGLQYLKESLIPRELPDQEVVESRLECSLYWRKVEEALTKDSISPLLELKTSNEQAAMVIGLGLGLMGKEKREKEETLEERKNGMKRWREETMEKLSKHERRRVRGIAARMRDEWNGDMKREERGALIYY
ncbi:hypothetical protein PENTCL1PPCAC_10776 [Pristionchus entomophagus]|uniref:Uncharacterized protein n=1 Tax=Pristionchus entomophagus TaxID=358040 RepID=A0AAV5SZ38_9BILA|nr:hypothetical protein PENTCL1PPCAC_10776 [Pristionchus entomophagus]